MVSILGMLAEAGVVLVKAEKQTRAEADAELKAHRDSVWAEVSSLLDDLAGEDRRTARPATRRPGRRRDDRGLDWSSSARVRAASPPGRLAGATSPRLPRRHAPPAVP